MIGMLSCSICLHSSVVVSIQELNRNNVSYSSSLKFVIPEIEWNENHYICESCIKVLKQACTFKNLCLKSLKKFMVKSGSLPENKSDFVGKDCDITYNEVNLTRSDTQESKINQGIILKSNNTASDDKRKSEYSNGQSLQAFIVKLESLPENKLDLIERECDISPNEVSVALSDTEDCEQIKQDIEESESTRRETILKLDNRSNNDKNKSEYFCTHCKETFKNKSQLSRHVSLSHKCRETFPCNICKRSFENKSDLVKHKETHKYHCEKCQKPYNTIAVLKKHILVKHTERKDWQHSCCYCSEVFPTRTHLVAHSKKLHLKDEILICSHCSGKFTDKNILLEHILEHHHKTDCDNSQKSIDIIKQGSSVKPADKPYKKIDHIARNQNEENIPNREKTVDGKKRPCRKFTCSTCGQVLKSSVKLVNHCVTEHNADPKSVKPFACDLCEKRFSTSTILIEHKRYHIRNRQNICSFCGKGFITKNDLNCHEYIHYNERSFKCEICFKGFNTQKNLRTHRIVKHGDPMSWKHCCAICNKRFAILSNFKVHVRRHMGDKQFCCRLCEKRFVNKDELRQHTESHSNIREFKCEYCEKEYKRKRIYEIHLAKAHGIGNTKIPKKERNHACHICPKSYFDNYKLTKHLMTHSGIKPFSCTVCNKKFTDNYYLKQHLKNHMAL